MKQFAITILAFFLGLFNLLQAQELSDTIFESRRSALDYIEITRGAMVDTTLNNLKELAKRQQVLIDIDNIIVDQNIPDLIAKSDTNKRKAEALTAKLELAEKELKVNKDLFFYAIIGSGALLVLALLFLILFMVSASKKKKLKKVLLNVEKIKEDNLKEIDLARKEVERSKAKANQELEAYKASIEKEVIELKNIINTLNTELSNSKSKLADADKKHADIQQKHEQLVNTTAQSELQHQQNEKSIIELKSKVEQADKERNDYKNLYENQLNECKILEQKLQDLHANYGDIDALRHDLDKYKAEAERNTEEVTRLNKLLDSEVQTKRLIEDELRRFLEELKGNN